MLLRNDIAVNIITRVPNPVDVRLRDASERKSLKLTFLTRMDLPTLISRTSPFPILEVLAGMSNCSQA